MTGSTEFSADVTPENLDCLFDFAFNLSISEVEARWLIGVLLGAVEDVQLGLRGQLLETICELYNCVESPAGLDIAPVIRLMPTFDTNELLHSLLIVEWQGSMKYCDEIQRYSSHRNSEIRGMVQTICGPRK